MLEARVLTKTQTEKPESLARTVLTIIVNLQAHHTDKYKRLEEEGR